jgi:hypothetical protein
MTGETALHIVGKVPWLSNSMSMEVGIGAVVEMLEE